MVETRALKGPRVYDASGIPLHRDNQSVIKERFYLDKADPNFLYDRITVIDHALTRPWTVTKSFRRNENPRPWWPEYICADGQSHVQIGKEAYFLSADGLLMPAKKDAATGLAVFQASGGAVTESISRQSGFCSRLYHIAAVVSACSGMFAVSSACHDKDVRQQRNQQKTDAR